MFYAWGYPQAGSVNTGYSRVDTATMYMIQDDSFAMYLVMTLDSVDGTSNTGEMAIDIMVDPPQSGIELVYRVRERRPLNTVPLRPC
jgi:hypothetical protein